MGGRVNTDCTLKEEFYAIYFKRGKHRRRCSHCRKLIQDGEMARFRRYKLKKAYPVKGIMSFERWEYTHQACEAQGVNAEAADG